MKIIELLNKIANGEEVPKKIKYRNCIFHKTVGEGISPDYSNDNSDFLEYISSEADSLNEIVEILEDNTEEIEELNDTCYDEEDMTSEEKEYYHNLTREQQNKILRAVKQLNKEIKSIKEK